MISLDKLAALDLCVWLRSGLWSSPARRGRDRHEFWPRRWAAHPRLHALAALLRPRLQPWADRHSELEILP